MPPSLSTACTDIIEWSDIMENPEVKRIIETRVEDAKLAQSRANMSCDSCIAVIIADFDFSYAHTTLLDPCAQAFIWSDGSGRNLLNVRGEWIAAYIEDVELLIDISRKYQYKIGPTASLVREFAVYMGGFNDALEWKLIR